MPAKKLADQVRPPADEQVEIYLNGAPVKVPADYSVLQAARSRGLDIPTLCYHPDLPSEGHCRLCLVEIGAPP
ncbi:MAG: (2Fe-2S)-binding protein, partial [Deltaproteobacteria bacterium]|nr:(2Fe-2S)-binding protein [Deltaproteobacteria bacterium]